HPDRTQGLAKVRWRQPDASTGPNNQGIDIIGRGEHPLKRGLVDVLGLGHRPGPDSIRQAKQRAAVRHLGECKPAVAISIDWGRPRKMRRVRAARHGYFFNGFSGTSARWMPTPR